MEDGTKSRTTSTSFVDFSSVCLCSSDSGSDRATLSNLLIGLNGYTVGTGIINEDLNGKDIISKPLISDEEIKIGIITRNNVQLSVYARTYIEIIKSLI